MGIATLGYSRHLKLQILKPDNSGPRLTITQAPYLCDPAFAPRFGLGFRGQVPATLKVSPIKGLQRHYVQDRHMDPQGKVRDCLLPRDELHL